MSDISEQLRDCVNRDDLPDWKLVLAAADRIEKLEAALTPFLKLPIGVINDDPPEMEVYQCHGWPRDQRAVVTVGDFYRVRKALEGKE